MTGVLTEAGVALARMADSFLSAPSDTKHAIRHTNDRMLSLHATTVSAYDYYYAGKNEVTLDFNAGCET